jgi:hypothetical protein
MIKNWKQFIKEGVTNPDSYLDMRMQEIKDLLASTENSESLIYEWENKNGHELFVNFSANGMNVRYEFDIDDMQVTKVANDVQDFTENVESMEAGVEMIKKDIHSILGISESIFNESKYEESILLVIEAGEGNSFLKNRYSNLEINRKLMRLLDKKFDLNLGNISDKHKIEGSKISDISKFLISLGLRKEEERVNNDRIRLIFKGNLTLKDFKKIK